MLIKSNLKVNFKQFTNGKSFEFIIFTMYTYYMAVVRFEPKWK